jgi:outer membrane protein assembly factor BamE (lipoprotein component of BamABCDE complex)
MRSFSRFAFKAFASIASLGVLIGCQSAADHAASVRQAQGASDDRLTVGTVQREIRVGMTSAEVVQVLGAPNMVTTDENRRENWVYDKIATETAYSTSSGGVSALILGGGIVGSTLLGGAGSTGYRSSAGAGSTNQRTLTIIVKYDESSRVRDFSYRSSSF